MSDLRDPLADVFFDLRIEAPNEIEVPGTMAVRRTVRNRRIARASAVAATVIAVAVFAGYALGGPRGGHTAQPQPSLSSSPSADDLDKLGMQALKKFGLTPEHLRPGTMFGAVREEASSFTYAFGTSAEPFPAGDYHVSLACIGTGSVTVTFPDQGRDLTTPCGGDLGQTDIVLSMRGVINFTFSGDAAAVGHAGIALQVTDPTEANSRRLLEQLHTGYFVGGFSFLTSPQMNADITGHEKGTYELQYVCTGRGTVKVIFTVADTEKTITAPCTATGQVTTVRVDAAKNFSGITVRMEPDSSANGAAGYAYGVSKV